MRRHPRIDTTLIACLFVGGLANPVDGRAEHPAGAQAGPVAGAQAGPVAGAQAGPVAGAQAGPVAGAQAGPTVEVIATDPGPGAWPGAGPWAELPAREPLYLRIAYESDEPLRFQARGWREGGEVTRGAAMNPAPVYPAGRGEAIVWVAYDGVTWIDEVRVTVSDTAWAQRRVVSVGVDVAWSGVSGRRTAAAWARELSDAQQATVQAAIAEAGDDGGGWFVLVFLFAGLSVPGYWVLQLVLVRRARDAWRRWVLLPLLVMVPVAGYTVLALLAGSNLWPLILLFTSPFAFLYLAALALARGRAARPPGAAARPVPR